MFITVKNIRAICQFLVYNSTTYSNIVQGIYLEEFTTVYSFSYIVVLLLFYWNMQAKPLWNFQVTALSTILFTVKLWKKKIIKDHWFIIYAMIHVFNWKMCLLDHSKIIHPLFSPSLIWQLDLNNTSKQMALEAKKICAKVKQRLWKFWQRLLYSPFERYMGVGVCVRVYIYIIDR